MDEHDPDNLALDLDNQNSAGSVATHSGLFRALGGTDLYNNPPREDPELGQVNTDSIFSPEGDGEPDLPPPAPHSPPVTPGPQSYIEPVGEENDPAHPVPELSSSMDAQPNQPGLFRALGGTDLYNNAL